MFPTPLLRPHARVSARCRRLPLLRLLWLTALRASPSDRRRCVCGAASETGCHPLSLSGTPAPFSCSPLSLTRSPLLLSRLLPSPSLAPPLCLLPVSSLHRSANASHPATLHPSPFPLPAHPHTRRPMSVDSSSTHRRRSVAARLVRLAAASAAAAVAVGSAAAWAHGGAVQHRCIHDAMQARVLQSVAQQRSHPSKVSSLGLPYVALGKVNTAAAADPMAGSVARATEWGSLRITVSTEDLTDPAYHCARVGQNISTHDGGLATCTADDILTDEKRDILVNYTLRQALQLHTDRLKVQQVQGKWKVTGMVGEICGSFKVPEAHITEGLSNSDFVIYVTSVPSRPGVVAWAGTCQVFSDGHPAVGVINIPAANIASRNNQAVTRVVTHEMAHALGFSNVFFEEAGILQQVSNVRGKPFPVPVIHSSTVVAKAREQYGCNTLKHLELEDQGGEGSAGSHIKMRNAQDELMAPAAAGGYYTALTMAIFQDLGFYQADFSKAEAMPWGKDAGCAFFTRKCMEKGVTKWPAMFCSGAEEGIRCPSSRLSLGTCDVTEKQNPPAYFQYFTDPSLAGNTKFMDHCPVVAPYSNGSCAQSASEANSFTNAFNVFSDAARCFDGAFRLKSPEGKRISLVALCANVKCDTTRRTYSVQVRGSSRYVDCTPGRRVELSGVSDAFEQGGYITCPPYVEVCQGNVQAAKDSGNAAPGHSDPRA
ncbi:GP63, leishmanolysin [Leishmania tarentolae]|uniref:Leishmanolysin n=1 Tax=Leishmania tarentolae TaxID=5689 RepID=A0A640K9S5_LEITA|nr:GP63, leishmanolysin [Leishmania tarentolae]GET86467.1 GP63, leishmanolysin [Leishmania tarentolae]GET86468.1 GP63, leishmanolysin [Leishmania tarentolae]GET86469.1 GP63, leishmanolysin [Leishmania tarentolae]